MRKTILFTRPCYDLPTEYLHYISGQLVGSLKFADEHAIIDLAGKGVLRSDFEKAVKKGSPGLVVLNGHGTKDAIYGAADEIVLDGQNVRILASRIVYAVACDSLEGLGQLAVNAGQAACYVGYGANFMIIVDPTRTAAPGKDKNIKPFVQVYATTVLSLAAGLTVAESIRNTKEKIKSLIKEYGVYGIRDRYGDAPLIRWALYWDLFFLSAHGDLDACF